VTEHFLLPDPSGIGARRVRPPFGFTPPRNPRRHGQALEQQLEAASPARPLRVADGVDPRYVFKLRSQSGFTESLLDGRQLQLLAEGQQSTYFVLADDGGVAFSKALESYAAGEDVDGGSGPLKSLYNNIDLIEPYGPNDRRGPGMDDLPAQGPILIDVTIWPSETYPEAVERADLLALVLQEIDGSELVRSVSARLSVVRCSLDRSRIDDLLDLYVVQSVRTPPVPYIDPSDWRDVDAEAIDVEWEESAPIGVLDDLPDTTHPVLKDHVRISSAPIVDGVAWAPSSQHGNLVSGLALGGAFAAPLRGGAAIEITGDVVVARVLESDASRGQDATRFPPDVLPMPLILESIRHLHEQGIRVFNLSFGYDEDYRPSHVGDLSEALDSLARELDVVIVVAAGNATMPGQVVDEPFNVRTGYPGYVDRADQGLAQPANAANLITVGGVAPGDAAWLRDPKQIATKAIAGVGEISPFSRTGPGFGKGDKRVNKPDFVAFAGNVVVTDTGMVNVRDQSSGVLSTASMPTGSFFHMAHGTSFASPKVAADAAAVLHRYPDASSNMVRALLASAARPTVGGDKISDARLRHRRYGFGFINRDDALDSGPLRATMTFDGDMQVDTTVLHPVPIPRSFALPRSSSRSIRVALAYDPPVRRGRREYTAATMAMDIYRNVTLEQLQERLRLQDPDDEQPLFSDRRRLSTQFQPSMNTWSESTLQVRQWQPKIMEVDDGDIYFIAVTHKTRTWFRSRDDYPRQRYALTVSLEDEGRLELDLETELTQQISLPARVRQQARS
jgi:hypothetical protein